MFDSSSADAQLLTDDPVRHGSAAVKDAIFWRVIGSAGALVVLIAVIVWQPWSEGDAPAVELAKLSGCETAGGETSCVLELRTTASLSVTCTGEAVDAGGDVVLSEAVFQGAVAEGYTRRQVTVPTVTGADVTWAATCTQD